MTPGQASAHHYHAGQANRPRPRSTAVRVEAGWDRTSPAWVFPNRRAARPGAPRRHGRAVTRSPRRWPPPRRGGRPGRRRRRTASGPRRRHPRCLPDQAGLGGSGGRQGEQCGHLSTWLSGSWPCHSNAGRPSPSGTRTAPGPAGRQPPGESAKYAASRLTLRRYRTINRTQASRTMNAETVQAITDRVSLRHPARRPRRGLLHLRARTAVARSGRCPRPAWPAPRRWPAGTRPVRHGSAAARDRRRTPPARPRPPEICRRPGHDLENIRLCVLGGIEHVEINAATIVGRSGTLEEDMDIIAHKARRRVVGQGADPVPAATSSLRGESLRRRCSIWLATAQTRRDMS